MVIRSCLLVSFLFESGADIASDCHLTIVKAKDGDLAWRSFHRWRTFDRRFVKKPLLIKNLTNRWRASETWTSQSYFVSRYGDLRHEILPQLVTGEKTQAVVSIKDRISH